jgi:hypothetical protein
VNIPPRRRRGIVEVGGWASHAAFIEVLKTN